MLLVARPRRPKGVLAGPGTPRDPKSHLFVTKWVAVAPFGTLKPGSGSEFRPGSRRGGPGAQIPTFLFAYFGSKNAQKSIFWEAFEFIGTHGNGFGAKGSPGDPLGAPRDPLGALKGLKGPRGPLGPRGAPRGPVGPHGAPWVPTGPLGAPQGPVGPHGAPWGPIGPLGPLGPAASKSGPADS